MAWPASDVFESARAATGELPKDSRGACRNRSEQQLLVTPERFDEGRAGPVGAGRDRRTSGAASSERRRWRAAR